MYRKLFAQFLLSFLIAGVFLWLTVRHMVADAGDAIGGSVWESLGDAIGSVSIGALAIYGLIFMGVHVARIARWQYLITPLGERDKKKIFRICAVGFSAIVIFPLRLGEMVRPYMLARESDQLSMSAALGTAVTERVIDGLLITGLLFLSLATYSGSGTTAFASGAGVVAAGIFLGRSVVLIFAAMKHDWTVAVLNATIGRVSTKVARFAEDLIDGFLDGVRVLRRDKVLARFLLMTAVYWGLNGFGIMYLGRAFGFELSLWESYGVLAILVVGLMIPAGPGFFGNFQFFLAEGLALFCGREEVAIAGLAFGRTLNTIQFVLQVGVGVPFYLASHVRLGALLRSGEAQPATTAEASTHT